MNPSRYIHNRYIFFVSLCIVLPVDSVLSVSVSHSSVSVDPFFCGKHFQKESERKTEER